MLRRSGVLVRQKFRQYLIPTLLTMLALSAGSLLELVMIGRFLEDAAMSAVGLAEPVVLAIDAIYLLFSVGGVTCASISLGKLDKRKANLYFTLSIVGGTLAMLLLLAVLKNLMGPLTLLLANSDRRQAALAQDYLSALLHSGPMLLITCTMADFISADGKPGYASLIILVSNGVRLVLDFVFIRLLQTGVWGAGAATAIGYGIGLLFAIPYLRMDKRSFHFVLPKRKEFKEFGAILRAGLSTGWMGICSLLCSMLLITLVVRHLGFYGVSILMVCSNIREIANVSIDSAATTLIPIAGELYGEKDYFGIRQIVRFALKILLTVCVAMTVLFLLVPQWAGMAFDIDSPDAMTQLMPAVRLYVLCLPLHALSTLIQFYYNTIQRVWLASVLAVLKNLVFVGLFAAILVLMSPPMFWLCFVGAEVCSLLVTGLLANIVRKKENLRDLLLLPARNAKGLSLDVTVVASVAEASTLSRRVVAFGRRTAAPKTLINHIAIAVEEMTICTAHYAHEDSGNGLIDLALRVTEDGVLVRFRDNGVSFNPMEYTPPPNDRCITDGIALVKRMVSSMQYSRQLGFNTTTLTFSAAPRQTPPAEAPAHKPS